jgi:nitroreductase/dihydropteridine reductase
MAIIENLHWRYATKKFDSSKKLSSEQLESILTAVQLSPSSYGLQPYRVIVIEDAAIREQLRAASYGQPQLTDASHVVVIAAETNLDEAFVKTYIDRIAETRSISRDYLTGFEQAILGSVNGKSEADKTVWNQKQAYIALGVLLNAVAEHHIDACPMEGFDAAKFDEILGLKAKGLTATVIAPIGFRDESDDLAYMAKVRRPKSELFIHL